MPRPYDIFHACRQDNGTAAASYASATLSAAVTMQAEGVLLPLQAAEAAAFNSLLTDAACHVLIQGGGKGVRGWVAKVDTVEDELFFVPWNVPEVDFDGVSFPIGSTVITANLHPLQLGIDLSDAPAGAYRYVCLAQKNVELGSDNEVYGTAKPGTRPRNILASTINSGLAPQLGGGVLEFCWNGIFPFEMQGGDVRGIDLSPVWADAVSPASSIRVRSGSILALRVDQCEHLVESGDGGQTEVTHNDTATHVMESVTLPADGEYIVVASMQLGGDNAGNNTFGSLNHDGSEIASGGGLYRSTDERRSWTCVQVIQGLQGEEIELEAKVFAPSTQLKVVGAYLAAFTLPPAFRSLTFEEVNSGSAITDDADFQDVAVPSSESLPRTGRYVEIVNGYQNGGPSTDEVDLRPVFGGDDASIYGAQDGPRGNALRDTVTLETTRHTFTWRGQRAAGPLGTKFQARTPTGTGTVSGVGGDFTFLALEERADDEIKKNQKTTVVAEVECSRTLKRWAPTATSGLYTKQLPDVALVARVVVNGVEYTAVTGTPAAEGEWSWDLGTHTVTVHVGAGNDPTTDAYTVAVIERLLFGRGAEQILIETPGVVGQILAPFRGHLVGIPTFGQSLDVGLDRVSMTTSIGQLELRATGAQFDDRAGGMVFSGLRVRVWRGSSDQSNDLRDYELLIEAVASKPQLTKESLQLTLRDAVLDLRKPATSETETVYTGATQREDQLIPEAGGIQFRRIAHRTTNNGGSDDNTFRVSVGSIEEVIAVYADSETNATVTHNSSAGQLDSGELQVNNAQWASPTEPPDVCYLDFRGRKFASGTAARTTGQLAKLALEEVAGLPAERTLPQSLFDYDEKHRVRMVIGPPNSRRPAGIQTGFYVRDSSPVRVLLEQLANNTYGFLWSNTAGRIGLGVPDLDAKQHLVGSKLDVAAGAPFPWRPVNAATVSVSTTVVYEGAQSLQVSAGADAASALLNSAEICRAGLYWFSAIVSLQTGRFNTCRLGIQRPMLGRDPVLSEAFELTQTQWRRISMVVELVPGEVGTLLCYIYPDHGNTDAITAINVGWAGLYPIAYVADERRAEWRSQGLRYSPEDAYQARVGYGINEHLDRDSAVLMTDLEAQGAAAGVSLERYALPTSTRSDIGRPILLDQQSAGGVAGSIVTLTGRQRHELGWEFTQYSRRPQLGDLILDLDTVRRPRTPDDFPIFRISDFESDEDNAQSISIAGERSVDPVHDRTEISPQDVPLGMVIWTVGACPTDFDEVDSVHGKFVGIAETGQNADIVTERGTWIHGHLFPHDHELDDHEHDVDSRGATPAADTEDVTTNTAFGQQIEVSPQDHGHLELSFADEPMGDVKGGPIRSSSASPTVQKAGNLPAHRKVRLCLRARNTTDVIPTDAVFGFEQATAPAGWARQSSFDGYLLRVHNDTSPASFSEAHTGGFTPVAGVAIVVGTNATIAAKCYTDRLVTIADDGNSNSFRAVVTAVAGTNVTLIPLGMDGDTTGVAYGAAQTWTSDSDAPGTQIAAVIHNHGGVVPDHVHSVTHEHEDDADGEFSATGADSGGTTRNSQDDDLQFTETNTSCLAEKGHSHTLRRKLPAQTADSGSAGGTIPNGSSTPPSIALAMISPTGSQTVVPAGLIGLVQGAVCPPGWSRYEQANGLLMKGASVGMGVEVEAGGHGHLTTFALHTYIHNHGGATTLETDRVVQSTNKRIGSGPEETAYGGIHRPASLNFAAGVYFGHPHDVPVTVESLSPTLQAEASVASSAATPDEEKPPYRTWIACRKD